MLASLANQTAVESFPLRARILRHRPTSEPARLGGVRSIGEILPMVMARLEEKPEIGAQRNYNRTDIVIAVRLSPLEMPQCLV